MRVDWSDLKAFVDARKLSIQYVEVKGLYWVKAFDGPFHLETTINKKDPTPVGSDQEDFETNYVPSANKKVGTVEVSGVRDPKGMRARLVGCFDATVTKTTTQDVDWQMPQLSWLGVNKQSYFDGIDLYCGQHEKGDSVLFQVVDKDGLVYPTGTVLEQFGDTFKIFKDNYDIKLYKAKIVPGMYLRVKYTSIGTTNDVRVLGNLYRHLNADETV